MTYNEYQEKLNRIQKLAQYSNTGTPKELAKKLKVSERTLYRLINAIKENKVNIEYSSESKSYIIKD